MRITLRQLAVFVAIAKEHTVTKAAETIALTQSAASMALLDLESGLGAPLFDRMGKRLQLNELGRKLLPEAIDILNRCELFESEAKGENQAIDLKIGATMTIADYYLPALMPHFITQYPNAKLALKVGNTKQIIESVANFQIDVGLIEGSCTDPHIKTLLWQEDELCVVATPQHPLAQQLAKNKTLQPHDFADQPWVLREAGSGTREVFDTHILPNIASAMVSLEIGHNESILHIVARSHNQLCCLSKQATTPFVDAGQLVCLPTPFWALRRPLYIIVNAQKFVGPSAKRFLAFLNIPFEAV